MMRHSSELISYCCVTRISWLQMWMVIVACHHWYIKLRQICDMAETSLVVRDGNDNWNSSPTFVFSIWGHLRIRVSKNVDASCRRKSNNGKRTRKWTRPIRFECSNAIKIHNRIMFDFYPGLPHFIKISTTLYTSLVSTILEAEHPSELVEVVCNTHFCLSSLSFLHLTLLQDGHFLIMRHISNVAS